MIDMRARGKNWLCSNKSDLDFSIRFFPDPTIFCKATPMRCARTGDHALGVTSSFAPAAIWRGIIVGDHFCFESICRIAAKEAIGTAAAQQSVPDQPPDYPSRELKEQQSRPILLESPIPQADSVTVARWRWEKATEPFDSEFLTTRAVPLFR